MSHYPSIIGINLDSTYDEFINVIKNKGYTCFKDYFNDPITLIPHDIYSIKIDENNQDILLSVTFEKGYLKKIDVKNWKSLFSFTNDMTFDNIIEIFCNYFLKGFTYKIHYLYYDTISCCGKNWKLFFNRHNKEITLMKRTVLEGSFYRYV